MSKKKVQIPFSIEAWNKSNTRVETKDGKSVRIVCTNAKLNYSDVPQPILGLITEDDKEVSESWTIDGHYSTVIANDSDNDLVIIEEVEVPDRWADDNNALIDGYYIDADSEVVNVKDVLNTIENYNVFATEKQAKSALAMARISQLLAHDERYGGAITEEEWKDGNKAKYYIYRYGDDILIDYTFSIYRFLAFHESGQRDLFLAENEQLIKDFLMID